MSEKKAEPILVNAEAPTTDLGGQGLLARPSFEERAVQMPEVAAICEACRKHHGSVAAHLECLSVEVRRLRAGR
jgi:hypothetical protein